MVCVFLMHQIYVTNLNAESAMILSQMLHLKCANILNLVLPFHTHTFNAC